MTVEQSFLALVRAGIGHPMGELPETMDWESVMALAEEHGLSAIVWDAVDRLVREEALSGGRAIPKQLMYDGFGAALSFEQRYEQYRSAIAGLAGFYASHGIRMMVLKGFGLSLNYPVPEHRPCGDIDIWLFGDYRRADELLARERGVAVDNSHHHHTVFSFEGFSVENHYDFLNIHAHLSNRKVEAVLKEMGREAKVPPMEEVPVEGSTILLPSPDMNALFLLRHAASHFAAERLTLRQVLDWSLFVSRYSRSINWEWLINQARNVHMDSFLACINAVCCEYLGLDRGLVPALEADGGLVKRFMDDVLKPEFSGGIPPGFFSGLLFRYRRWRANAWKHRMVYPESLFKTFWVQVWAHLLKPSSLKA